MPYITTNIVICEEYISHFGVQCKLQVDIPITLTSKLCLLNFFASNLQIYRFIEYSSLAPFPSTWLTSFKLQYAYSYQTKDLHVFSSSRNKAIILAFYFQEIIHEHGLKSGDRN